MKKILILLILIGSLNSVAQTYRENLEKYWYYRHVLKEQFMYYSGNASLQGSHHVAENKNDDGEFIRWADGVWWLGHYIGVLAIEYRLLKENGEDYSETLDELNLAFDTYNRLDYNAEPCFNNVSGNEGNPSINGFFLRDDLDASSSPDFNNYTIIADYYSCQDGTESNVNSQDQCIMMFLGLNLVHKLVDDENIQNRSEVIAGHVITRMRWFNFLLANWVWEIRNPVTLGVPVGGNVFELYSYCWAYAEAAGKVTGQFEHKGYSSTNKAQFDIAQDMTWDILQGGNPLDKFTGYFTCVLSAIVNEGAGHTDFISDGKSYDWLERIYSKTKGYEGMPASTGLFPHLPLVSELLHGYDGDNRMPETVFEDQFLNIAPPCGSYNYGGGDNSESPWHTMSLFSPWHRKGEGDFAGEYNMLDYMMLYNLYFYNYLLDDVLRPYISSEGICPELIDLPEPHTDYWIYTIDEPKIVKASIEILGYDVINSGGGVVYKAGERIKFMPGFTSNSGSYLLASIDNSLFEKPYYIKTNVDPCNGGTFYPVAASYQPSTLPLTSDHSQFPDSIWQAENWEIMENLFGSAPKSSTPNKDAKVEDVEDFFIYPNPTNSLFNIKLPKADVPWVIQIVDFSGREIHPTNIFFNGVFSFNLSAYKSGIYFVHLKSQQTDRWLKVVKQ